MARGDKAYYCEKCGKTMNAENFYTSNNLEKYPDDGKLKLCKKCLTMHVDNYRPETYLWILKEVDVPYIPEEWNKILQSYINSNRKITPLSIIGRYLSKMKLVQYANARWADTEKLQELANKKVRETMTRQGYSEADIEETIMKGTVPIPENVEQPQEPALPPPNVDDYFARVSGGELDDDEFTEELTDEDRKYLRLKWGKTYKPEEWVRLEQLYNEMMESYDIQSAGHIDILKKCCKTSLKADQLLDIGDVEGAQKMVRMYDMLMKAGKFTAAQNKGESGDAVDSVSELIALCESDGFIPRYYVDGPQDKVDRTIQDLQNYTNTLIREELNLGNLIEGAMKQIELDKIKEAEQDADAADDDDLLEQELFEDTNSTVSDEDFTAFNDWEDDEESEQDELYKKLESGEL